MTIQTSTGHTTIRHRGSSRWRALAVAAVLASSMLAAACSSDSGRDEAADTTTAAEPPPSDTATTEVVSTDAPTTESVAPGTDAPDTTDAEDADALAVELAPGAGEPTAGSGIATTAALENPRCTVDDETGPYGRFPNFAEATGPVCVRPFEDGEDNGGSTSRGVTADAITVVYLVPAADATGQTSSNRATGDAGNDRDAFHDIIVPQMQYYETWGRALDIRYVESTGADEAAQRADAITVLGLEPFAVVNGNTAGLDVFEAEIAKADTLVFGYSASPDEVEALAPYRWGGNDPQAAMVNSAEVIGKQLAGKPAEWAGSDDLTSTERTFGLVYMDDVIDDELFAEQLAEYDVELSAAEGHPANGSTFGDPAIAQQFGPTIVAQLKDAGVTTVVLASDVAMIGTMMAEASRQNWYPEWFVTGAGFFDFQPFTSGYPADQASQMFGIALLSPYLVPDADPAVAAISGATAPINWYYGEGTGTTSPRVLAGAGWLMAGIHSAGPDLTPETFTQGLFSIPASGGSMSGTPIGAMTGFGETTGLPYPGYFVTPVDFAPEWISVDIEAPAPAIGAIGKPSQMFVDGGTRYASGNWPTEPIAWFDESQAITSFETRPEGTPVPVPAPCQGCPTSGGADTPGSPSPDGFVVEPPAQG